MVAAVLPFCLAACAGDAPAHGTEDAGRPGVDAGPPMPDVAPPHACGATVPDDASEVRIAATSMQTQYHGAFGFDLDGYDTRSPSDAHGCGKLDEVGGIDASFRQVVEGMASLDTEPYWARTSAALGSGQIRFDLALRAYDGSAHDDCVWARFELDGMAMGPFVPAVVVDGTLEVSGGSYQLLAPIPGTSEFFPVDVEAGRASVPLDGSEGRIGGVVPWFGTLRERLVEIARRDSPAIDASAIDEAITPVLDMDAPGSPSGECDAISLGFDVRFAALQP